MIPSTVFALGLLLVSPAALARVQMHTKSELKNDPLYGNHTANVVFKIDANESLEVFKDEKFRVVAELLAEKEDTATVCFTIYAKNAAGQYEQILAPVLVPNYTDPAMVRIGSTAGDSFTITVEAQKI